MTSNKAALSSYVPSASKSPYRAVMNSPGVQARVLAEAERVASRVRAQGVECRTDVLPGRMRAHARATIDHTTATSFRERGHNLRMDRVLLAALQSIRRK